MSVRRKKDGTLFVDIDYEHADGRRERIRKTSPVQTVRAAEQYERQIRQSLLDGTLQREREKTDAPTLAAFWPRFLEGYVKANREKPSSLGSKESIYKCHLEPVLGAKRLNEIDDYDVQALKARLADRSPKTVNNVLTVLSRTLRIAVEWNVITRLPCKVRLLKSTPPPMEFYEDAEFERLLEAAAKLDPRTHLFVLLGGEAGLRSGEILGLEWSDVDLTRNVLTVNRSEWRGHVTAPKGGRSRPIPLTERLAAALNAMRHLRGDRVLYRDDGESFSRASLHERFKSAQKRAGLAITGALHVLRHTFCSALAIRGAPPKAIQELAGHVSINTTMRYMHLAPSGLTAAIGLLNRRASGTLTAPAEPAGSGG